MCTGKACVWLHRTERRQREATRQSQEGEAAKRSPSLPFPSVSLFKAATFIWLCSSASFLPILSLLSASMAAEERKQE